MNQLHTGFKQAAIDYLYLLEKSYSQKSILKLIGDKYQLTSQERSMLFRGIHPSQKCRLRKKKMILKPDNEGTYFIDGYNIIRSIGSYLLGKPLFISTDGYLRDASEMHRSTLNKKVLHQTLDLIGEYFLVERAKKITIYLDQPVSKSGELAAHINTIFSNSTLNVYSLTVYSPDHELKLINNGIVCTSDSNIIDNSQSKIFDLARAILDLNYQPEHINLEKEIMST